MARRPHLLLALLAVLACGALLTACGGSDEDVDEVLAQTFGGDAKPVRSGKLDVSLRLDPRGGRQGPVSLRLTGPFSSPDPKRLPSFDFTVALNAGGQRIDAGAVSTGDEGFLRLRGQAYDLGDQLFAQFKRGYEEAQKKRPDQEGGPTFRSLGIDPRRWLRDPTREDDEEVGGTEAIHISGPIDVPRFLQDLDRLLSRADQLGVTQGQAPQRLTEPQRRQVAEAVRDAKVDVWTGKDDKILRRIALTVDFDVPEAQRARAGLAAGKVALSFGIGELNERQRISAPSGARPLSELQQALQGLGVGGGSGDSGSDGPGSSGSGSGGSGSSGSGGSSGPSGGGQDYLDCLEQAGSDAQAVSRCADLLTTP